MYLEPFSWSTLFTIIAAAVFSIMIRSLWYHPRVFGSVWMRLSNITPEIAERAKRRALANTLYGFVACMIAAYVLYWFGAFLNVFDWVTAFELSFWCWLGFTAPTMIGSSLWAQRPIRLILIDVSYWLVTLTAMACILLI